MGRSTSPCPGATGRCTRPGAAGGRCLSCRSLPGVGKLFADISISLDGFVAGPKPSLDDPLGKGGEQLHEWAFAARAWREPHGMSGGEDNAESQLIAESIVRTGATIMGRRMFSGGEGPWEDDPNADAWWGEDPPFHHPVFVLTNHEREPLELKG